VWMTFCFRKVLGSCIVFATCAGALTAYTVKSSSEQKSSHVEMTVMPVGGAFAATSGKSSSKRHGLFSGIASWYGGMFDGRRTANGEIYDKEAMTACHRTLPFGTLVRVINLRNRHSVVVRINDRGVLTPERIIDLSSAAAEKLGMLDRGTAPVRLEIVSAAVPEGSTRQPG
jgi:rare lipoprotein A